MYQCWTIAAPVGKRSPMQQRRTVDEALKSFLSGAESADPTVRQCDGQGHEDQESKPADPG